MNSALSKKEMEEIVLKVGSDCPFFLQERPLFAEKRGEILNEITLSGLKGKKIVLIYPKFFSSTAEIYSAVTEYSKKGELKKSITTLPLSEWRGNIKNDLEVPFFKKHPTLTFIKKDLYKMGALYASLSGSGSCFYGIFENDFSDEIPKKHFSRQEVFITEILPS